MNKNLRRGILREGRKYAEINPLDGVANLADCMLVLACGLMLSLVVNWNLDLAVDRPPETEDKNSLAEVSELQESDVTSIDDTSEYEELGKLYRDPRTGEIYAVME